MRTGEGRACFLWCSLSHSMCLLEAFLQLLLTWGSSERWGAFFAAFWPGTELKDEQASCFLAPRSKPSRKHGMEICPRERLHYWGEGGMSCFLPWQLGWVGGWLCVCAWPRIRLESISYSMMFPHMASLFSSIWWSEVHCTCIWRFWLFPIANSCQWICPCKWKSCLPVSCTDNLEAPFVPHCCPIGRI